MKSFTNSLSELLNNKKSFFLLIVIVFIVKLCLLPWSAHPFDFWSFVNTIQRQVLYGWNIFEYWNKGNLLIVLWYPLYALYVKTIGLPLFGGQDQLLLLHFLFKVAFLVVDLLCGYLIFSLVLKTTNQVKKARLAFILWYLNPIPFYVFGIHGHYELLVPFSIILFLFGLNRNSIWLIVLGFVVGFSTKYFNVILLPFALLYLVANRQSRLIGWGVVLTIVALAISYLQFFFYPELIRQTINSVITLSSSNAPIGVTTLHLTPLNIVSALHFLISPSQPVTNVGNPFLFHLANQGVKLFALFLLGLFIYRIYAFRKTGKYTFNVLIKDFLTVLTLFLILLTNFQPHYVSWLIPLLIILLCTEPKMGQLNWFIIVITALGFIYAFKSEFGPRIFFLDILNNFSPSALNSVDTQQIYTIGTLLVFSLIASIAYIWLVSSKTDSDEMILLSTVPFLAVLWAFILVVYLQAIYGYFSLPKQHQLDYSRDNRYHAGIIDEAYTVASSTAKTITFGGSQSNSLILQILPTLSKSDQSNFRAYLLLPTTYSADQALATKLNSCSNVGSSTSVFDYTTEQSYPAIQYPVNCIKSTNNQISGFNLPTTQERLYVENEPVNYLYQSNKAEFIAICAVLGALYLVAFGYSSVVIIKNLLRNE